MPSFKEPFKEQSLPHCTKPLASFSLLPAGSGRLGRGEPEIWLARLPGRRKESFLDSVATLATGLLSLVPRLSPQSQGKWLVSQMSRS